MSIQTEMNAQAMRKTRRATAMPGLFALAGCAAALRPAGAAAAVSPLPDPTTACRSACAGRLLLGRRAAWRSSWCRRPPPPAPTCTRWGSRGAPRCSAVNAAEGAFGFRPQDLNAAYFPVNRPKRPRPHRRRSRSWTPTTTRNAEADLKAYDEEFELPECTSGQQLLRAGQPERRTGNLPFPKRARPN